MEDAAVNKVNAAPENISFQRAFILLKREEKRGCPK